MKHINKQTRNKMPLDILQNYQYFLYKRMCREGEYNDWLHEEWDIVTDEIGKRLDQIKKGGVGNEN